MKLSGSLLLVQSESVLEYVYSRLHVPSGNGRGPGIGL